MKSIYKSQSESYLRDLKLVNKEIEENILSFKKKLKINYARLKNNKINIKQTEAEIKKID